MIKIAEMTPEERALRDGFFEPGTDIENLTPQQRNDARFYYGDERYEYVKAYNEYKQVEGKTPLKIRQVVLANEEKKAQELAQRESEVQQNNTQK